MPTAGIILDPTEPADNNLVSRQTDSAPKAVFCAKRPPFARKIRNQESNSRLYPPIAPLSCTRTHEPEALAGRLHDSRIHGSRLQAHSPHPPDFLLPPSERLHRLCSFLRLTPGISSTHMAFAFLLRFAPCHGHFPFTGHGCRVLTTPIGRLAPGPCSPSAKHWLKEHKMVNLETYGHPVATKTAWLPLRAASIAAVWACRHYCPLRVQGSPMDRRFRGGSRGPAPVCLPLLHRVSSGPDLHRSPIG